jgi:hypothetical protein
MFYVVREEIIAGQVKTADQATALLQQLVGKYLSETVKGVSLEDWHASCDPRVIR